MASVGFATETIVIGTISSRFFYFNQQLEPEAGA